MKLLPITPSQYRFEYVCDQIEKYEKQKKKEKMKKFKKKAKICKELGVPITINID